MKISITDCVLVTFRRPPVWRPKFPKNWGSITELIEGRNGVFDVVVYGNLVEKKAGRFPQTEEILGKLGKQS